MPFSLAYDTDVVILLERALSILHSKLVSQQKEDKLLTNLGQLEEKHDLAQIKLAAYHQQISHYYNKNTRGQRFLQVDFVLHEVQSNTHEVGARKLGPNLEGSHYSTCSLDNGAYCVEDLEEK